MTTHLIICKKNILLATLALLFLVSGSALATPATKPAPAKPDHPNAIRACFIGGMTRTGLWDEVVKHFEAKPFFTIKLVAAAPFNTSFIVIFPL